MTRHRLFCCHSQTTASDLRMLIHEHRPTMPALCVDWPPLKVKLMNFEGDSTRWTTSSSVHLTQARPVGQTTSFLHAIHSCRGQVAAQRWSALSDIRNKTICVVEDAGHHRKQKGEVKSIFLYVIAVWQVSHPGYTLETRGVRLRLST